MKFWATLRYLCSWSRFWAWRKRRVERANLLRSAPFVTNEYTWKKINSRIIEIDKTPY